MQARLPAALPALRILSVAVLGFLAFVSVLPRGHFVFDDHVLIERNLGLLRADAWWKSFQRDYYATSERPGDSGYYRPVAVLANAADAQVWRMRPRGFHITNLLLHAGASVALLAALGALGAEAAVAWVAALYFAVHPLHAESVAFVSGRVDVLAGLAAFLAMAAAARRRRGAWIGVGLASLLAFLAKEIAVVLPILLVIVWQARRSEPSTPAASDAAAGGRPRSQALAVAAAALLALGLRYLALHGLLPASAHGSGIGASPLLPLRTLSFDLAALYAPVHMLSLEPEPARLDALRLAAGIAIAAGLWFGAWRASPKDRPLLRRCLVAALVALLPVLNLLPQETQLSERFLYLASGFLLAPAAVLVLAAWRKGGAQQLLGAGAAAVVLLYLLNLSLWRGQSWRNDVDLWQRATQEEPGRAAFWDRLGLALVEKREFIAAEPALRKAVELDPRSFNAQLNLGALLVNTRRPEEAIAAYRKALAMQPRHVNAHVNLGLAYLDLLQMGPALQEFQQALSIMPDHFEALRYAGGTAMELGRLREARHYLEHAQRLVPNHHGVKQTLELLHAAELRAGDTP